MYGFRFGGASNPGQVFAAAGKAHLLLTAKFKTGYGTLYAKQRQNVNSFSGGIFGIGAMAYGNTNHREYLARATPFYTRASIALYNDEADIQALIDALKAASSKVGAGDTASATG